MTWETFTEALVEALLMLRPDDVLVVSHASAGGQGHHVRFRQYPERLEAEFVAAPAASAVPGAGRLPGERAGLWRAETAWPAPCREYRRVAEPAVSALRAAWGDGLGPEDLRGRTLNERLRPEGDRGSADGLEWEAFAQALAAELAELPAGALVVISERNGDRFAQFAQNAGSLYAELSGREPPAGGPPRVSPEGERVILKAGWRSPAERRDRIGNYWTELAWPASWQKYRELADRVVTGLRDGQGVALPDLHYRAWNSRKGNRDLDLPRLGLPRDPQR